ncbi:hypothetical protein TTHERM_00530659 (macronuclear) [Tetrahymena thermophila SB210]|uniref:Uncharacterized protein n=1 Tax=Tetrahymena thermophila (strain SB210) TaxID=312017 RepID=A4VF33_TETTS|nr:hypothetical protein TTHERM_00530659 [Tetrahymena thermophila SB210]EDK31227.1 hypothetical protein TTHERM_00530659 [Tetrahymena thermophila SB210]|eukprot:XP_001470665.1 hypothetical protein TTHERM_00530659 [Tetrahymena thermophila SB210]
MAIQPKAKFYLIGNNQFLLQSQYPIIQQKLVSLLQNLGINIKNEESFTQKILLSNEDRKKILKNEEIQKLIKIKDIPKFLKQIISLPKYQVDQTQIQKKIKQLSDVKPSKYFVQFFIDYIEKQGKILFLDDEIFPKVETISFLIKILCLNYEKPCLIVTDSYKVDNWKIKVQKWIPNQKISKIQNQNDTVQSCPLVIIVNYEHFQNNYECLSVINFEFLILDIHVDQIKTNNYDSLCKIRSNTKSVIIIENYERLNTIEDYWLYLAILHSTIFKFERFSKLQKRYAILDQNSVSYQEFSYILSEFFQTNKSRENHKIESQSLFQKFSIELNLKQKKQVQLIQRQFNGWEIQEFANIGYHTNEDINTYFQYLTNLKEQHKNTLLKYLSLLKRKTLVIADGDQVLCKLFKKYKNVQFISSESDLSIVSLKEYGQILILEIDQNYEVKKAFIQRLKQDEIIKTRMIFLEIADTLDSTLIDYFIS